MGIRINALTETTSPGDTDNTPLDTSAGTRRITWANIKAAIFGAINGLTSKSTPVGADVIAIGDSAASFAGKTSTVSQIGTAIKTAQRFTSSAQTITTGGSLTIAHGLGVRPFYVSAYIECTTAENGYSIGDRLYHPFSVSDSLSDGRGVSLSTNGTVNIDVRFGNQSAVFLVNNKTTGAAVLLTNANWRLYVIAEA